MSDFQMAVIGMVAIWFITFLLVLVIGGMARRM